MKNFRKATPNDASIVAQLLMFSMQEIVFDFIGEKNSEKAIEFLTELIKIENNQYSYENTWIYEIDDKIAGTCILYDGALLEILRKPVLDLLASQYNRNINPQDETESGEIYIDNVAIFPEYRGKGIGSEIFQFIIDEFAIKQGKTLGLLVDFNNLRAKKLYESLGFKVVGEKQLMSENHFHMQLKKGS
ncbi:GNAT family N-acetyltransferase [Faecalibacter bovis]|uniref:GNAT family N-acetyltransferase n=1 Tax=Faecalibacter bovis TaxID=2898187 RepID=A0ABX7XC09_9FLAO|nr:GNAT family N-acetyltransferase [Faecalibacter bovis]MBS7332738.1 GNAT family N-acetyltransferase [Weeksellaceae bacterium]QTV05407.1 GNAT family N-acetyltransferase [Faecalibacter bovis]